MHDRSDLGLRGPVKSSRSERTFPFRCSGASDSEERRSITTTEYDREGRFCGSGFKTRTRRNRPGSTRTIRVGACGRELLMEPRVLPRSERITMIKRDGWSESGLRPRTLLSALLNHSNMIPSAERQRFCTLIWLRCARIPRMVMAWREARVRTQRRAPKRSKLVMTDETDQSHWLFTAMIKNCCVA
jgi:hypothetical protein